MRNSGIRAVLSAIALVMVVVLPFFLLTSSEPAKGATDATCVVVHQAGPIIRVQCTDPETGEVIPPGQVEIVPQEVFITVTETVTAVETTTLPVPGPTVTLTESADEPDVTECRVIKINGPNAFIECYDENGDRIPAGQVDLPEVIRRVEVFVPGPTRTMNVRGPVVTETVTRRVPGPVRTETQMLPVEVTETVTDEVTVEVTRTVEAEPTGQPTPDRGNMDGEGWWPPDIDFGDGDTTITEVVAVGIPLLLAIICALAALYSGYILGFKDKEKNETDFLRSVLDASKIRR